MHELRKDPIIGRWVVMARDRARRPGNFIVSDKSNADISLQKECCFCEGHEKETPPEIYAIRDNHSKPNTKGWKVRVVPDKNPILDADVDLTPKGHGLYDVLEGRGAHEVIVETPNHIANMADLDIQQIALVVQTYVARINDLEKDKRLQYVLAHKNYNWSRDSQNITHSYSEIIATPVNPMRVKEELNGSKKYFDYHERCIYCDLIKQEVMTKERVVFENDHFLAIVPFASRFPFELWILPKKHSAQFPKGVNGLEVELAKALKEILLKVKKGLGDPAYHFVIHTAPFQRQKGKSMCVNTMEEDYHWHIEIMPRLTHTAGFEKGTGFYICPIPPEEAASYLREVEI